MDSYVVPSRDSSWGTHTIEIDLQIEDYKGTITYQTGGNCVGASILNSALSEIEDGDYEPHDDKSKHYSILDDEGYLVGFRLFDESGDDWIWDVDSGDLGNVVVGVRIVNWEPEE